MLQLGLVVGAVMFLSPVLAVVARVLDARAGRSDLTSSSCSVSRSAWRRSPPARARSSSSSAYVAWRPRYFAGAVAAALAAPYAQRSHYVPLYAAWFGAFAVLSLLASLLGATLVPLAAGGAEASEVSGVLLGFVGARASSSSPGSRARSSHGATGSGDLRTAGSAAPCVGLGLHRGSTASASPLLRG